MKAGRQRLGLNELLNRLDATDGARLNRDWLSIARPDQLPPDLTGGDASWRVWLLLGGRGSGKTRAGAEWVRRNAMAWADDDRALPPPRIALIGPDLGEVRSVMVEGVSGLLAVHEPAERPEFEPSKRQLVWKNGAVAQLFSAEDPESLRGPQFSAAWCDELAKWSRAGAVWDMLQFGLRLGERPQAVITTTPRPEATLKRIMHLPGTRISRSTTFDNAANLAAHYIDEMKARYGGTNLGRQELLAELIEDDGNALFRRHLVESARVKQVPPLARIVVAVDPPVTSHRSSNACGIVCAGRDEEGHAYVLEDATLAPASPARWAERAVDVYRAWLADRLVAEVNQGGDLVEAVIRQVDDTIAFKPARAVSGKRLRAEPVAALYEQGRVHHVGLFAELEDELAEFGQLCASTSASPDRVDALVWAVSELLLGPPKAAPRIQVL